MAALANPSKSGTLYSGARYVALWASCFVLTFFIIFYSFNFSYISRREICVYVGFIEFYSALERLLCNTRLTNYGSSSNGKY